MKIWKPVQAILIGFAVLVCASPLFAAASPIHPSYQDPCTWTHSLHVQSDLDGDRIPDTAVVRRHGNRYTLSIHFSANPNRTFHSYDTTTPVTAIKAIDVDGDHDRDIVLLGPNPVRAAALWLNESPRSFHTAWVTVIVPASPDALIGRCLDDDDDTPTESNCSACLSRAVFGTALKSETVLRLSCEPVPLTRFVAVVPPRGPPLDS
jgi:hypothetical protein